MLGKGSRCVRTPQPQPRRSTCPHPPPWPHPDVVLVLPLPAAPRTASRTWGWEGPEGPGPCGGEGTPAAAGHGECGEGAQGKRWALRPPCQHSSPPRRSDPAPLCSYQQLQNHKTARNLPLTTGCEASYYHRCLNALTYIDILVPRLIITGYS